MYRMWGCGLVQVADASTLRALRAAVVDGKAGQEDNLRLLDPDPGAVKGRQRSAFTARWRDPENGADVHALYVFELTKPPMASWAAVAVSDKKWTYRSAPPCERPAFNNVIEAAGLTGQFYDRVGVRQSGSITVVGSSGAQAAEEAKIFAAHIMSPHRTTALYVGCVKADLNLDSWWGVVTTTVISEDFRRLLNNELPASRAIPARGARLYVPELGAQADQVFSAVLPTTDSLLMPAIQQLFSMRQQTPLPEEAVEDAAIGEWWTSPPADLLLEQQRATMEAQAERLQQELDAERRRVQILTEQNQKVQRHRDVLREENGRLQEKLDAAMATDPETAETVAQLRAQLATITEELRRYEAALEEVEAERDELARVRFVLAHAVAQRTSNDQVEAEFDHLLDQSALGSPVAQGLQALTPDWVHQRLQTWLDARGQGAQSDDRAAVRPEFTSFPELLAHADKVLPGIVITAGPDPAAGLDHHPKAAAWRRKTWDALATLNAYVEARRAVADGDREPGPWSNDVLSYIKAGEPGALVSANIVSLGESEGVLTNERFRQARTFPVPVEVDETGKAVFVAHVGIERFKAPAPRLYFLDDVSGTGVVYVGYLGPHLPTTRTN